MSVTPGPCAMAGVQSFPAGCLTLGLGGDDPHPCRSLAPWNQGRGSSQALGLLGRANLAQPAGDPVSAWPFPAKPGPRRRESPGQRSRLCLSGRRGWLHAGDSWDLWRPFLMETDGFWSWAPSPSFPSTCSPFEWPWAFPWDVATSGAQRGGCSPSPAAPYPPPLPAAGG